MTLSSTDIQTYSEIREDYSLLIFLVKNNIDTLLKTKKLIERLTKEISPKAYENALYQNTAVQEVLQKFLQTIIEAEKNIEHNTVDNVFAEYLINFEYLRSLTSIISGILSSLDTQSPSFFSSWYSQAGKYTGQITQSFNDYCRDQHFEGNSYEKTFKKEYIDAPYKSPFHVYATNSGMSALTTIVGFISGEEKSKRPVFMGKSCYFEEKFLLRALFSERIVEVDEQNIPELIEQVKQSAPAAIFLDSLSNSASLVQPDMGRLLRELRKMLKKSCYVVIDNTGLSVTYQPFANTFFPHRHLHLIVWESLIKHHQFGFDKVNGGIIYTNIHNGINIYAYRDHLGTNINDIQALTLPMPNRQMLSKRLMRHERNIRIIIEALNEKIRTGKTTIERIISPADSSHKSFPWAAHQPYHGAYITLSFLTSFTSVRHYKSFMKNVFVLAKTKHIPLVGGTSFGFPVTRVYVPASRPGQGVPFVRIAVGTEPLRDILRVANVISEAMVRK